jgi:drug/metabolite transporter (DMT)-like permease
VQARQASPALDLLLVLASISWAAGAVFSRQITARGSALLPVARQMIIAGVVLLVVGLLHGDGPRVHLAHVRMSAWLGFAYLLLIGSASGYPVYIWLMRICPPSKVATIPYMNLLVAVGAGWALGHETLTPRLLAGTGIVVVSVAIVLRAQVKSARPRRCRPDGQTSPRASRVSSACWVIGSGGERDVEGSGGHQARLEG